MKIIHWKSSAKAENYIVKEFEEEIPAMVSILFDVRETRDSVQGREMFEKAVVLVSSLVWEFSQAGYLLSFAQSQDFFWYGRGKEHALEILRKLALADYEKAIQDHSVVKMALQQIQPGTTAILVFLEVPEEIESCLPSLSHTGCHVMALSLCPIQNKTIPAGWKVYQVQENEEGFCFLSIQQK